MHLLCPNQYNNIHVIQPRHIEGYILLHIKPLSCQTGTIYTGLILYNDLIFTHYISQGEKWAK